MPMPEAIAIAAMVLVTYVMRLGGVVGMAAVRRTPRIERFVSDLGSSVVVAVLAAAVSTGTPRTVLAVLVSAAVMLTTRRPLPAMLAGVAAAAMAARLTTLS